MRAGAARRRGSVRRWGRWLVGLGIGCWVLIPLYWTAVVSLIQPVGLISTPPSLVPRPFTLSYYRELLSGQPGPSLEFLTALRNSVIEATGTTIVTVVIALLAAYAFARWRFRGSSVIFLVVVGTLALPVYAVLIPLFSLMTQAHQVDSYQAVIVINASASLPFATWLLRSHIAGLPRDIESAAVVDGANARTVVWKIVAPLIAPGVATAAVLVFLMSWGAYLIPLTFATTSHAAPLTVLIPQFTTRYSENYGLQAAAGILSLVLPVSLVLWMNKHILNGLLAGAGR